MPMRTMPWPQRSTVKLSLAPCVLVFGLLFGLIDRDSLAADVSPAEQREFFENRVRPLLATHCYECHSAKSEKLQAGLRVDHRSALLRGGDSGPAVIPGDPDESLIVSAVRYESFEMPPRGRLAEDEIATLERWVRQGAWWPPEEKEAESAKREGSFDWAARKRSHWAWQPLARTQPPTTATSDWDTTPIDQFILARLKDADLQPSAPADPHRLIRRLFFDLVGLPPSPEDIEAFVQDRSEDSYRQWVDKLLASESFGEKWARHWLDLVRYAETCGHEFDYPIPHAYRYRDYVIRAFNADLPYDQWVREHIAGDLLTEPRRHPDTGANESILGTGFWFLGEAVHAPTDVRGDEADRVDNQIDVFGKAFLGMTIACARCHDHKFDPIPTSDYYAMAGFLQSSRRQEALLDPHRRIQQVTAQIKEQRSSGDRMLAAVTSRRDSAAVSNFADYLIAAQNRLAASGRRNAAKDKDKDKNNDDGDDKDDEKDTANDRGDSDGTLSLLNRFVAAMQDDALRSPRHPLHAWWVLANDDAETRFAESRRRLAAELRKQQQAHDDARSELVPLAEFRDSTFADWYVTGWAFGDGPTREAQWDGPETDARLARPGVAHSGRLGRRQYGVLRSPTFALQHDHIHYRIKGSDIQLRLIVDGYVMDVYSQLLFADITLDEIDTDGQYRWVTQHRDLDHYQGHRAHIEVIDHGEGYVELEGIYFSNSGPPPEAPHAANLLMAEDESLKGMSDLAAAYERYLRTFVSRRPTESSESSESNESNESNESPRALWNWLLKWQLIDLPTEWATIAREVDEQQTAVAFPLMVTAMTDGSGEDERVHIRGGHRNLGDVVPRHVPVAVVDTPDLDIASGSGRLELAERLLSSEDPLLSRVIVNRLWHHLMGRGIVPTVDNMGVLGQPPSHPQLLDWLACDLVDHQWSLKHTIRQIVLSKTYRQTSKPSDAVAESVDPDDQWWHRSLARRLPAEAIRDSMLSISGRLDPRRFGPSVPVHLTEFMTGRGRPKSGPLDGDGRRSIYTRVQRNFLSPMMLTFDMPSPFSTMGRRNMSNVPAQSLILMNDPFVWQQARLWARQVAAHTQDHDQRIHRMYLQAFARPPRDDERERIRRYIVQRASLQQQSTDSEDVWTDVGHALWNMKEFLFLF